jgi:hypothetical protein
MTVPFEPTPDNSGGFRAPDKPGRWSMDPVRNPYVMRKSAYARQVRIDRCRGRQGLPGPVTNRLVPAG